MNPYEDTGKLLPLSLDCLDIFSLKDIEGYKESMLPVYLDEVVKSRGVNTVRGFADSGPGPYRRFGDPDFYPHLDYRLNLFLERKLTPIISMTPYGGTISDDQARELIRRTKKYKPIFETENEPQGTEEERALRSKRLVDILQAEGVENKWIQIPFCDCSIYGELLAYQMKGEGLSCYHWCGTMDTINAPWPDGWSTSEGMMLLMRYGLYGSNDGQDFMRAALGLYFWAHLQQHPPLLDYRRSRVDQIYAVTLWMLRNGRGWEHLSASAYQESEFPKLMRGIEISLPERQAIARAWHDYLAAPAPEIPGPMIEGRLMTIEDIKWPIRRN